MNKLIILLCVVAVATAQNCNFITCSVCVTVDKSNCLWITNANSSSKCINRDQFKNHKIRFTYFELRDCRRFLAREQKLFQNTQSLEKSPVNSNINVSNPTGPNQFTPVSLFYLSIYNITTPSPQTFITAKKNHLANSTTKVTILPWREIHKSPPPLINPIPTTASLLKRTSLTSLPVKLLVRFNNTLAPLFYLSINNSTTPSPQTLITTRIPQYTTKASISVVVQKGFVPSPRPTSSPLQKILSTSKSVINLAESTKRTLNKSTTPYSLISTSTTKKNNLANSATKGTILPWREIQISSPPLLNPIPTTASLLKTTSPTSLPVSVPLRFNNTPVLSKESKHTISQAELARVKTFSLKNDLSLFKCHVDGLSSREEVLLSLCRLFRKAQKHIIDSTDVGLFRWIMENPLSGETSYESCLILQWRKKYCL